MLHMKDVAKVYRTEMVETHALRDLTVDVRDGEFVDQRPAGLRQNQRLGARILIEERPNVLKVERGPWLESGGGNIAYFVDDGVAERRSIRTGAVSLDAVEIVSGAKVGDEIVVAGAYAFGTSQRVRIAD